jgi:hypothetical protein
MAMMSYAHIGKKLRHLDLANRNVVKKCFIVRATEIISLPLSFPRTLNSRGVALFPNPTLITISHNL